MIKDREKLVLQFIVQTFIETGSPIGSRYLAKKLPVEWSAATIRNIMSDLEEQGFLTHPHTSAGRMPTDKAYRTYVNAMMRLEKLSLEEKNLISSMMIDMTEKITQIYDGVEEVLYHSSKALAKISNELGVILSPRFNQSVFDRLVLNALDHDRILIELTLKSGAVKSVTLELHDSLSREYLHTIQSAINERLTGLTVEEIRKTISERLSGLRSRFEDREETFIRIFLDSAESLFNFEKTRTINFAGANNILMKPEFSNSNDVQAMLELLEEKDSIIQLLSSQSHENGVSVSIGEELGHLPIVNYSLITANYRIGESVGSIGIIGPKRMRYSKLIPLAKHTAHALEKVLNTGVYQE